MKLIKCQHVTLKSGSKLPTTTTKKMRPKIPAYFDEKYSCFKAVHLSVTEERPLFEYFIMIIT